MKKVALLFVVWMELLFLAAQPLYRITQYNEEDGVPSNHITQMLQDGHGFMWFSTWNGLCRFDGYEFETFKPEAGDGCHIATDRLRDISLLPDGNILCREDDDYYLFNLSQYRFRDLTGKEAQHTEDDIKQYRQSFSLYHKLSPTRCALSAWTFRQRREWRHEPDRPSRPTVIPAGLHSPQHRQPSFAFRLRDVVGTYAQRQYHDCICSSDSLARQYLCSKILKTY